MIIQQLQCHEQDICVPDEFDEAWWVEQTVDTMIPLTHEPPPEPSGPLAWWIELESAKYLQLETEAGRLVYRTLWNLAQDIRSVDAKTVTQYLDRMAARDA